MNKLITILTLSLSVSIAQGQDQRKELWNNVDFHNLRGDYQKAILYMDSIIDMGSNLSKNYLYRGSLKQSAGMHQDAIADFDQSITLNPNISDAYVKRAMVKLELEQREEAIADFDKGVGKRGWQDSIAHRYRGRAYHDLGKFEEALKDYEIALTYHRRDVELISNVASAYMAIGENDKALDLIELALKIEGNYIEATKQKSILSSADYQNAKRVLNLALDYQKFHPLDDQNNLNIGYLYVRMRQPEKALKNLNKIDGPLTKSFDFYFNRGKAFYYKLDNDRAISNFEAAIQERPENGISYVFLADCHKEKGQKIKRCENLKKASDLGVLGAQELLDDGCK